MSLLFLLGTKLILLRKGRVWDGSFLFDNCFTYYSCINVLLTRYFPPYSVYDKLFTTYQFLFNFWSGPSKIRCIYLRFKPDLELCQNLAWICINVIYISLFNMFCKRVMVMIFFHSSRDFHSW